MAYQPSSGNEEIQENDIYKSTFKQFKLNGNSVDAAIDAAADSAHPELILLDAKPASDTIPECSTKEHFKPYDEWKMFTLKNAVPGLIIIPGILRDQYRMDWFGHFHDDLPMRDGYDFKANTALKEADTLEKLRWITFGYHHNWDSKLYTLDQPSVVIPERIQDLSKVISTYLNLPNFRPQAGIVNYYNRKSTLCFHTDDSELDHTIPLLSFSLGSPAIFLIGGQSKEASTPIVPLLLRDSDVLIMTGDSRLALHAVPRIVVEDECGKIAKRKVQKTGDKSKIYRINVSVRQVMQVDSK